MDSVVTEHERRQKDIAAQMEQMQSMLGQFQEVLDKDIKDKQKTFETKLSSLIDKKIQSSVDNAVKKILDLNLNETIQSAVNATVSSAIQKILADNLSATIRAEVANAVRAIQQPDYSATIRAEVANAVKEELQKHITGIKETTIKPEANSSVNIRDEKSWELYRKHLLDTNKLEQFAKENSIEFRTFALKLKKIKMKKQKKYGKLLNATKKL